MAAGHLAAVSLHPPFPPQEEIENSPLPSHFHKPRQQPNLVQQQSTLFHQQPNHLRASSSPFTADREEAPQHLVFGTIKCRVSYDNPKRSYASALQANTHSLPANLVNTPSNNKSSKVMQDLSLLQPSSVYKGKPSVIFKKSENKELIESLHHVLVAKFSHGKPSIVQFRNFLVGLQLKGDYNFSCIDSKHVFIECTLFADYVKLWLKGIWVINGFPLRILKWTEDFVFSKESAITPVWMHLPGLPLYLYKEEALASIANVIGRPLKIDGNNINRTKLGCASICIELDASIPVIEEIWISFVDDDGKDVGDGFWQRVLYESKPSYCCRCYHLGHTIQSCKRKMMDDDEKRFVTVKRTENIEKLQLVALAEQQGIDQTGNHNSYANEAQEERERDNNTDAAATAYASVSLEGVHEPDGTRLAKMKSCGISQQQEKLIGSKESCTDVEIAVTGKDADAGAAAAGHAETVGGVGVGAGQTGAQEGLGSDGELAEGTICTGSAMETEEISATAAGMEQATTNQGLYAVHVVQAEGYVKQDDGLQAQEQVDGGTGLEQAAHELYDQDQVLGLKQVNAMLARQFLKADIQNSVVLSGEPEIEMQHSSSGQIQQQLEVMKVVQTTTTDGNGRQEWEAKIQQQLEVMKVVQTTTTDGNGRQEWEAKAGQPAAGKVNAGVDPAAAGQIEQVMKVLKTAAKAGTVRQRWDAEFGKHVDRRRNAGTDMEQVMKVADGMAGTTKDGNRVHTEGSHTQDAFSMFLDRMDRLRNKEPNEKGNVVTWPKIVSGSLKVIAPRSISPVGRSSEKKSKLRKWIDYLKYQEGQALVLDTDYYNELDERLNEDLREQVAYYKEERQASSPKDSTEIVPPEMTADASQEQDRSSANRRGRNKNRNRKK